MHGYTGNIAELFDEPPARSLDRDELVRRFLDLDTQYRRVGDDRREIAQQIASIAAENQGNQGTVRLTSSDGSRVKVQFGVEFEYEAGLMMDVLRLLGQERFDELFETRLEFKARKRNLNGFMNTVHASEQEETAKQIIKDATVEKIKTPYVSRDSG